MGIATKYTDAHTETDHVVQFIIVVVPGLQDVCFRSYQTYQGGWDLSSNFGTVALGVNES